MMDPMLKRPKILTSLAERARLSLCAKLPGVAAAILLLSVVACSSGEEIPAIVYTCETSPPPAAPAEGASRCGAGDPNLPPEPTLPTDVCQTLTADKSTPDESKLDTERVQAALNACKGRAVKLTSSGKNNVFLTGHLSVASVTLWIDAGTTLYASRNAELYQKTGSCGVLGVNDSGACNDYITVSGTSPGIVGDGVIDGQGTSRSSVTTTPGGRCRAPSARSTGASVTPRSSAWPRRPPGSCSTGSRSTTRRSSTSSSPRARRMERARPRRRLHRLGVTILTPSRWKNSQGLVLTPHSARNTDGIDPGATDIATCGVIACSTISTSDDQIAIKGGHWVSDLVIAHNHFGTGHGMSIGSETYGSYTSPDGVLHRGVENVTVYDLTIDGDSRAVGFDSSAADSNGIRIKSDSSRGGLVNNITFRDVCMRDMANAILVSTAYNPLFAGTLYPEFKTLNFQNIHHVSCMALQQPVVTIEGFNADLIAGPITLDNVVVDNIGANGTAAEFADIRLGPGDVNFMPTGRGVQLTNNISGGSTPRACVFPTLPTPQRPEGWLW